MAVVRHDDQCAFKINQRFGERLAHVEIQVVGRFIEQQQIWTLPDDQRQYQARFLAAGETLRLFRYFVALETEAAEIVAQLLLQFLRRQTRHMLQRGFIGAQELQLVLGEVAELNAFGEADFTVQRFQFARQQLDQRRFPRAVATQQADTRAGHQVQLDGFQNDAIAITCADFFHLQQRVRQAFRCAEAEMERVVDMSRRNQLHTLQHLDTALRLLGLGRFGAETVDVALQMRHTLLLTLIHRLLLRQARGALNFKRAVVAGVLEQSLLFDMDNFIHYRVKKVAIVGDQNQGARIALQPFFQPDNGIQIEVVGRFVEQQ